MGWWKDDVELSQYYGELDRRDQERRRELDMQLIGSSSTIDRGQHGVSAAERSHRRRKYRADAERQRDWIEREVRNCVYFAPGSPASRGPNGPRGSCGTRIPPMPAQTRLLRDDVRAAADANQRGLQSIASALDGGRPRRT